MHSRLCRFSIIGSFLLLFASSRRRCRLEDKRLAGDFTQNNFTCDVEKNARKCSVRRECWDIQNRSPSIVWWSRGWALSSCKLIKCVETKLCPRLIVLRFNGIPRPTYIFLFKQQADSIGIRSWANMFSIMEQGAFSLHFKHWKRYPVNVSQQRFPFTSFSVSQSSESIFAWLTKLWRLSMVFEWMFAASWALKLSGSSTLPFYALMNCWNDSSFLTCAWLTS